MKDKKENDQKTELLEIEDEVIDDGYDESKGVVYCNNVLVGTCVMRGYDANLSKDRIDYSFDKKLEKWIYILKENPNADYYLVPKNKIS